MKFATDLEFLIVLLLSLLISNVFLNEFLLKLLVCVIVIVIFGELTFGDLLRLLRPVGDIVAPVDGRANGFALV